MGNIEEHNIKKQRSPEMRRLRTLKFLQNQPNQKSDEETLMGAMLSYGVGMQTLTQDLRSMMVAGDIEKIVYYKIKRNIIDKLPDEIILEQPQIKKEERPKLLSEEEFKEIGRKAETKEN